MPVQVRVPYKKSTVIRGPLEKVYLALADVKHSVPLYFPGLEAFIPKGTNRFEWVFKEVGFRGQQLQIRIQTEFRFFPVERIEIHALPGPSSATGQWTFKAIGSETEVGFEITLETQLPVPGFLKAIAGPLAQAELTKFFDHYLHALSNIQLA